MFSISGSDNDTKIVDSIIENMNKKSYHHDFPKHIDKKLRGPLVNRIETYQMPYMMRSNRNYGEYCTDFIEQNALELYLLGKFNDDMGTDIARLKQCIEDRNPHTKIFAQGIVKLGSKEDQQISLEYDMMEMKKIVPEGWPTNHWIPVCKSCLEGKHLSYGMNHMPKNNLVDSHELGRYSCKNTGKLDGKLVQCGCNAGFKELLEIINKTDNTYTGEKIISSIIDKINLLRERRDYKFPKKKRKRKKSK